MKKLNQRKMEIATKWLSYGNNTEKSISIKNGQSGEFIVYAALSVRYCIIEFEILENHTPLVIDSALRRKSK